MNYSTGCEFRISIDNTQLIHFWPVEAALFSLQKINIVFDHSVKHGSKGVFE